MRFEDEYRVIFATTPSSSPPPCYVRKLAFFIWKPWGGTVVAGWWSRHGILQQRRRPPSPPCCWCWQSTCSSTPAPSTMVQLWQVEFVWAPAQRGALMESTGRLNNTALHSAAENAEASFYVFAWSLELPWSAVLRLRWWPSSSSMAWVWVLLTAGANCGFIQFWSVIVFGTAAALVVLTVLRVWSIRQIHPSHCSYSIYEASEAKFLKHSNHKATHLDKHICSI